MREAGPEPCLESCIVDLFKEMASAAKTQRQPWESYSGGGGGVKAKLGGLGRFSKARASR